MKQYDSYQIAMSEGCNYHCSFCWFCGYPPSGWSGRNIDRVLEELRRLKSYGSKPVFTIDDELTFDPEYAKRVCQGIVKAKINMMFSANTRADRAEDELLEMMSRAGFFNLQFGVESGCQEILDRNGTRKTLEQAKAAFALLEKHRIASKVFFLIGLLHETRETVQQTFRFVREELNHYDASFDIAIPYPGTSMHRFLKRKGWIRTLDPENLSWIYFHVYGCRQLAGTPMRKPFWRIGKMTFDDLYEMERKFYRYVPRGGLVPQLKRLMFNRAFRRTTRDLLWHEPGELLGLAARLLS